MTVAAGRGRAGQGRGEVGGPTRARGCWQRAVRLLATEARDESSARAMALAAAADAAAAGAAVGGAVGAAAGGKCSREPPKGRAAAPPHHAAYLAAREGPSLGPEGPNRRGRRRHAPMPPCACALALARSMQRFAYTVHAVIAMGGGMEREGRDGRCATLGSPPLDLVRRSVRDGRCALRTVRVFVFPARCGRCRTCIAEEASPRPLCGLATSSTRSATRSSVCCGASAAAVVFPVAVVPRFEHKERRGWRLNNTV
eukprot:350676-Chlamydomonas_euryale.AAC.1